MLSIRCSLPLLFMLLNIVSYASGADLESILEDVTTQPYKQWRNLAMCVMVYLIISLILFLNTFLICRFKSQPKQTAKTEPTLKSVVINVHAEKEPRVVNLSLRQTLPSDRRSSLVEPSEPATLERIITTKTARLRDSERRAAKTAREGLSQREKALIRAVAASTARSLRDVSKKSKKSSKRSSKKSSSSSSSESSSTSSSSSSSSSSGRSSRSRSSRRTSGSSRRSSARSSRSSRRSSRSDTSLRRSSGRSRSSRSSRRK
ncbi:hypothetical protein ACQ4LE_006608 [Meloidogyne hapla]